MRENLGVERDIFGSRNLQGFEQAEPAVGAGFRGLVETELEIDIDEARGVLGALEVAAHPIEVVGDAGEHRSRFHDVILTQRSHARSTHVSLLPPPCEELTTSDPRRRATRVRPPGTRVTFSP